MAREKKWSVDGDSQIHLTIEHKRGAKKPKYSFAVVAKTILISASLIASLAVSTASYTTPVYAAEMSNPTAVTQSVTQEDTGTTRLAGQSRYETAVAIAHDGWEQADYAILAYGENYPDALASAPLAQKYNAPILLTDKDNLTDVTKQVLQDLKVKNVFIVGGTGVVSPTVESQVRQIVPNVERLAGNSRYDTSVEIAKKLGSDLKTALIATGDGYADALSGGSIAAKMGIPILLVQQDSVPDSVKSYLADNGIQSTYVLGGFSVVSEDVKSQLPNPTRLSGNDRYATNAAVLNQFDSILDTNTVCVSTGEGFADALTGAAYAARIGAPVVLMSQDDNIATQSYINKKLANIKKVVVFGGEGVVPSKTVNKYMEGNPILSTIRNEVQLVERLGTAANFVKTLYGSNTMSATALNQLAERLVEIETRLNAGDLEYGQNLINSIKNTDTIISGVNINKSGLTKMGDVDGSHTRTLKVLNSVKDKVGLPVTNTGGTDQQQAGSKVIYVAPITDMGQRLSLTAIQGYQKLNVLYGYHTYGSNSQTEYNAVMEEVNKYGNSVKQKIESGGSPTWQAIVNYHNGSPSAKERAFVETLRGLDVKNLSLEELKRVTMAYLASTDILNARTYDGSIGESSYSLLFQGKGDCNATAYTDQAIWDSFGFNTRIQYNNTHGWAEAQINGKWFIVEGGIDGGNKPTLGTLIPETTSGKY